MRLDVFRIRQGRFLTQNRWVLCFTVIALALSFMTANKTYAQEGTVSQTQKQSVRGKVTDETGKPLQGVSVTVKGSSKGVATNENGEFSIDIPEGAKILQFSYVGMEPQEVKIGNQKELNVSLAPEMKEQQEVVVIGYGTQKKQAVTGAVVKADLKTYENVTVNNIMEVLKGTVAGLNVGEANTAGGVPGVTIRGTNSIAASTSPLIVLDGVIFSGSLADISPSDVESVTVLKDASAAAVYGSRSANGVILIESKKGTGVNGKPKFELRTSYGSISELKPLEVYGAQGYMQRLNDVLNDNGTVVPTDQTPNYLQTNEKVNYNATPDHKPTLENPYSLFSQTGYNFNTSLSVSQRTDKMSYFLSGNYTDQKGVIIYDRFKHYSIRLNLESKITNWLTLGVRSFYSNRSYPDSRLYGVASNSSSPYLFSPYADVYNADGSYNMFPQTTTSFVNPFSMLASEAYNRTGNLNGIGYATVKVPWVKGLSYTATYSKTLNTSETGSFYGFNTQPGQGPKGTGSRAYARGTATLFDHLIKYNRTFAQKHNVDLTLLHSDQKSEGYGESLSASGFDNDQLGTYRLSAGAIQTVSTSGSETQSIGQMARLTYTYDGKYSVTGTIRHDGYSAFSNNHKYGDFSSVGVNWNISKEKFMENSNVFNSLALRASYGTNGNQSIAPYSTLARITNGYYYYQGDANYTYTQAVGSLGNDDLVWESTTGLNFGLDFSILKNRLSGSIDGYATRTNNLAFTLQLPAASGFTTITANAGEIQNRGLEMNLRSVNITNKKFNWRSEAAFSLNRNEVTHLLGDKDGDGKEDDIVSSNLFIGRSLSTVYNYQVEGMWQQSDKDAGTLMAGFQPGTYKLRDVNHDGKITSDSDRVFLGNSGANFRWSLTNTFTYGDWSLMVYINSIWGGGNYFINGGNTPWNDGYANRGDMNHPVYDYWTPGNPNAEFPRPSYTSKASVRAPKYYDRSFIRLQKLALSYEATRFVKKYGIQGLNISLSADNLGTYAPKWIGLDAATGSGLTVSSIPSLRNVMVNFNINF
jgi:TonB-linked SusC/RagA family outer membrane protein